MEEEVKSKTDKSDKKKQKLTTFSDIDASNPKLYNSELDIYLKNKNKCIYTVRKRIGKIYYVVDSNNNVEVCAVKKRD